MSAFPNPFVGNIERKMNKTETVQAIRQDISGELEAVFTYEAHAIATDDPVAKKTFFDIANEEKVHIGELFELLEYLDKDEAQFFLDGRNEVKEIIKSLK